MQVTITENEEKNAIELLFSENLPKEFSTFLLELGFREVFKKKNTWYADAHPAYKSFATSYSFMGYELLISLSDIRSNSY